MALTCHQRFCSFNCTIVLNKLFWEPQSHLHSCVCLWGIVKKASVCAVSSTRTLPHLLSPSKGLLYPNLHIKNLALEETSSQHKATLPGVESELWFIAPHSITDRSRVVNLRQQFRLPFILLPTSTDYKSSIQIMTRQPIQLSPDHWNTHGPFI